MSFADGFVLYAQAGSTRFRYVASSVADALAWKALKEDDGYRVTEPVAYDAHFDNVIELRKDGTA